MPDREHKLRGSDPRLNEPRHRGDCRTLDLKSGAWQWKTNGHTVFIYAPDGKRHDVRFHEVLGITQEEWHRHVEDWRDPFPLTPKDVSDYINETILGRTLEKA